MCEVDCQYGIAVFSVYVFVSFLRFPTAKMILERLEIQTKLDRFVFLILQTISPFFCRLYGLGFYVETIRFR